MEFLNADGDAWLDRTDLAVCIANRDLADNPLSRVNVAFYELTGYAESACRGYDCRFLQGPDSDPAAVARMRDGVRTADCRLTVIRNYRRDGQAFDNAVLIGPLPDGSDRPTRLFGLQWDIEAATARRVTASAGDWATSALTKRIHSVERMATQLVERARANEDLGERLLGRLVAAIRPQQYPVDERRPNWTRGDALISYLLLPYQGRLGPSMSLANDTGVLASDAAPLLALCIHELVRVTLARAQRSGGLPDVRITLDDVMNGTMPSMRLAWQARWIASSAAKADEASERGESADDALALLAETASLADGLFDSDIDRDRFSAELTIPNHPTS